MIADKCKNNLKTKPFHKIENLSPELDPETRLRLSHQQGQRLDINNNNLYTILTLKVQRTYVWNYLAGREFCFDNRHPCFVLTEGYELKNRSLCLQFNKKIYISHNYISAFEIIMTNVVHFYDTYVVIPILEILR